MEKKKALLIDANSLLHRAYHALPPLKTRDGQVTNAIYGFFLIFLKAVGEIEPDFILIAFDIRGETFRHKEYKKYKGTRIKAPDELYWQIEKTKEILKEAGFLVIGKEGYEADDIIGSASNFLVKKGSYEVYILSGDNDLLQLVSENIRVVTAKKGIKETAIFDPKEVSLKFGGLKPIQIIDYKGLRGDPSDNIPGVNGIGEKIAIYLLNKYNGLENIYKAIDEGKFNEKEKIKEKLVGEKEKAILSKKLATIKTDKSIIGKDIEEGEGKKFSWLKLKEIFNRLEFYSLVKKIDDFSGEKSTTENKKRKTKSDKNKIEELYQKGLLSEKIYKLEKELLPIVAQMERNGILVDERRLKELSILTEKEIKKIEKKIYEIAGVNFNINSPRQVADVLFNKLKISSEKIKKTAKGAISTSVAELEKLRDNFPIAGLIADYRELFKLKTGFIDALPKFVNPEDGRIHPKFHQLGAATGRMSCSEPNLQNIPNKEGLGEEIRRCFVAPKNSLLFSFDYSQMELRVAAFFAGEKKMIEAFSQGKDIHKTTAAEVFQIKESEISKEQRRTAKALNFGIIYGIGPHSFSQTAGISFSEAKLFIQRYFEKFPKLAEFREKTIKEAKETLFAETFFGRKRFIPEINSSDRRLSSQAERIAINTRVQGTASDIIKTAMVGITSNNLLNNDFKLILQIHDELLFEGSQNVSKDKLLKIKKIMEEITNFPAPIKASLKKGGNWADMENVLL